MALSDYLRLDWFGQPDQAGNAYRAAAAAVDITPYIESLDKFTDVGTGETCSASIMLRAHGGDFVTERNGAADPGTTPIIRPFDLFRLAVVDDEGDIADPEAGHSFWRWLIQGRRAPQLTSMGQHLTLDLHGREWWLQQFAFPGRYYFRNFKEVAEAVRKYYNDNGRAKRAAPGGNYQPAIASEADGSQIDIPEYTFGIFEFGDSISCYDALMEVVRRLDLPHAAGGGGQHYALRFVDKDWDDPSEMIMQIHGRGTGAEPGPGTPVNGTAFKPISYTEVREPPAATVVIVKGQEGAGTVPPQIADLRGYTEEWNNLPEWDAAYDYDANVYVRRGGSWYKSKGDAANKNQDPAAVGSTFWDEKRFHDYMNDQGEKGKDGTSDISSANKYQYSPWTEDKATAIARNAMGNPAGGFNVNASSVACPDMNLVVRDDVLTNDGGRGWRTWVDCRATSEGNIPADLKYGPTNDKKPSYWGLRVLNVAGPKNDDSTGPFAGSDKLGKARDGAVLVCDRDGDWIVFKEKERFNEVAVLNEGRVYEYNGPNLDVTIDGVRKAGKKVHDPRRAAPASLAWRDISGTLMGNDCFHYPSKAPENVGGLVPLPPQSPIEAIIEDSAIRIRYERNAAADALTSWTSLVGKAFGSVGLGSVFNFFADLINKTGALKAAITDAELDLAFNVNVYNDFWGTVLFEAPMPKTTYNGISEQVGALYGGTRDDPVPLFDAQNQTRTPKGGQGWTAEDAAYLGQTSGIHLLFRFDIGGPAWQSIPGNIPISFIAEDHYDNVWRARASLRYQRLTQAFYLPWSSFSIYRARLPVALQPANYIAQVIRPELAVTEVFDPRLIKRIKMQVDVGYDDEGRYDPWSWEAFVRKWALALPATISYEGTYDAFCFVRKGLAIAVNPKAGTGELPRIDKRVSHPSISNAIQLRKIARSERDIAEHEANYITLKYQRYCGLRAEQFLTIKNEDFIADNNEGRSDPDKSLKMICKKITYSVTGRSGAGGLIADVELFRKVGNKREDAIA